MELKYSTEWDIDSYYDVAEPEEHWLLRKQFMKVHKAKFPEKYLVAFSKVLTNIDFFDSLYSSLNGTLKLINQSEVGDKDNKDNELNPHVATCSSKDIKLHESENPCKSTRLEPVQNVDDEEEKTVELCRKKKKEELLVDLEECDTNLQLKSAGNISSTDQWSPLNPDGKKVYDADFLLALRNDPKSNIKPDINLYIYKAICKKSSVVKSSSQHQDKKKEFLVLNDLIEKKDEEDFECLCKLLTTVGKELEEKLKNLNPIFNRMKEIVDEKHWKISSRINSILQDVIDLRNGGWVPRRQDTNPKTIDQIQKEAETEQLNIQAYVQQQAARRSSQNFYHNPPPTNQSQMMTNHRQNQQTQTCPAQQSYVPVAALPQMYKPAANLPYYNGAAPGRQSSFVQPAPPFQTVMPAQTIQFTMYQPTQSHQHQQYFYPQLQMQRAGTKQPVPPQNPTQLPPPTLPIMPNAQQQQHQPPPLQERKKHALKVIDVKTGQDLLIDDQVISHPPSGESSARHTPQSLPPPNEEVQAILAKQLVPLSSKQ